MWQSTAQPVCRETLLGVPQPYTEQTIVLLADKNFLFASLNVITGQQQNNSQIQIPDFPLCISIVF